MAHPSSTWPPSGFEAGSWHEGFPPHSVPICRFAPSLRQLKQQAFLLHFPPTLPSRLIQRLQEVSGGAEVGHRAGAAWLTTGWA